MLFILKRNYFIIICDLYNDASLFLPPQYGQNKRPQRRRTSPGAVNHLTPRCDWPAAEALISGARSWAQSECATRKRRCAPIFPSTLFPATTFKDYSVFPHRLLFVWHLGIYFWSVYRCVSRSHGKKWDMITLPPESAVFSVVDLIWEEKRHREPFLHSPPLKMLSARTGHILHPDYLQPLPSAPVSPIEVTLKRTLSEDVNAKQRLSVHFSSRRSLFSTRNTVNTQPCHEENTLILTRGYGTPFTQYVKTIYFFLLCVSLLLFLCTYFF